MMKFEKLGDEEGNVEFVQPLVDNPSGESNEVYSKEEGNRSLNYFQKVSVGLMVLIVILMFALLVVIWIGAHNDHVKEKTSTTPGLLTAMRTKPTTKTISSTIHSQHVFSVFMGFTYPLQNPISDMRPSYKSPGLNDILFKQSTSTKNTDHVRVNTATSPHRIFATTPSADKRNTVDNHESQDRITTDLPSVKKYTNSADPDDKRTVPETVFLIRSSAENRSTTGKDNTEMSQDKISVHVPCDKEHTKNSVDADDGVIRTISPGRL